MFTNKLKYTNGNTYFQLILVGLKYLSKLRNVLLEIVVTLQVVECLYHKKVIIIATKE